MASKSDQNQVLGQELVETPSRFEKVEPQATKKLHTLFLRTYVTLEVEGRQIHVDKQTLADHSPVFKGMFEFLCQAKSLRTSKYFFLLFITTNFDTKLQVIIYHCCLALKHNITFLPQRQYSIYGHVIAIFIVCQIA